MKLIEPIIDYIKAENTDFAILINGKWGSGKTYYLKNIAFDLFKKTTISANQQEKTFAPYYISLFGVSSVEELNNKLLYELNPGFKKSIIYGSSLVKRFLEGKTGINLKNEFKQFQNLFNIPKSSILIFDDLERLDDKMLNETFGFLNYYIEHEKIKCIIIADEQELIQKFTNLSVDYNKIKEKLIRFTYNYDPKLIDIFPDFLEKYKKNNKKFVELAESNRSFICELFDKGKYHNLRTLRFILDLLEDIFNKINNSKEIEDKYKFDILDRFIFFLVTYSIEYKKEHLIEELDKIRQLSNFNSVYWNKLAIESFLGKDKPLPPDAKLKEPEYYEKFRDMYLPFENHHFDFYDPIATYVNSGFLNQVELNSSALNIQNYFKSIEAQKEYKLIEDLKNFHLLEDTEFDSIITEILKNIDASKYPLVSYPNIFLVFLQIEFLQIHDFKVSQDIIDTFIKGMNNSLPISEFTKSFEYSIPIFEGTNTKYEPIRIRAIELNNSLKDEVIKQISESFMKVMESKDGSNISSFMIKQEYFNEPFFKFIDSHIFFDITLALSNIAKYKLYEGFHQRYINYNTIYTSSQELSFFNSYNSLIKNYIEKHPVSIDANNLQRFVKFIDEIIARK